jgi:tRNA pseudouridine55 synthase
MAVGVLPLCIGSAARITEYLDLDYKKYRCEMQLGLETDTQDIWGRTLADRRDEFLFESEKITAALEGFQGNISQYPPAYSAVRVDGRRLYDYARRGESVEIKPRAVCIKNIMIIHMNPEKKRVLFDVECSKGTYIRTICHDAGRRLGCGAVMSCLIRTASGAFKLENTVTVEELAAGNPEDHLMQSDFPLVHFGAALIGEEQGKRFLNGGQLRAAETTIVKEPTVSSTSGGPVVREDYRRAYNIYLRQSGEFLGVAFLDGEDGALKPDKVFPRAL